MRVILASRSPRRQELLERMGIPFTVRCADIDEAMSPDRPPFDEAARVSRAKALAVSREENDVVIAADTIVVLDGRILGKPPTAEAAAEMLRALSGRTHEVMTGLTVLRGENCFTCTEVTQVRFRPLSEKEILRYVATGEPMDKAGAYGIQGGGAVFAEALRGDYYNVMGLPVCRLYTILRQAAPEIMEDTL